MDIYGGGGKVAGGTYIFLLYLGMLIGAWYHKFECDRLVINLVYLLISVLSVIFVCKFICTDRIKLDQLFPFGKGLNPPGISLMIYALAMLFCIFYSIKFLNGLNNKYINAIINVFDYIGKHTLFIFLYHKLFLDYYLRKIDFGEYIWWKRLAYFIVVIGGPLIIELISKEIEKVVSISYGYDLKKRN